MPQRKLEVVIVGDSKQLERTYGRVEQRTKTLGSRFSGLGKAGAIGAGAAGVALLTKGLIDSVGAAKDAEAASARLAVAFKNAHVNAKQRAAAQAKINAVSKSAALDDEDLSDVLSRLTLATGSVEKAQMGMALAANIARARNIPLATAAKAVERTMLGSATAIERYGVKSVEVTTATDKLNARIKKLRDEQKTATGERKKAIDVQIAELETQKKAARQADENASSQATLARATKQFSGAGAAYAKTAAGAQDQLSVAFENLQEKVGQKVLPILAKLSLKLVELIDWSEKNWPKFAAAVQRMWNKAKPLIDNLMARIRDTVEVIKGVVRMVDAIAHGEWGEAWAAFKQVVVNELKLIYHTFLELPGKVLKALGAKAWAGLKAVGATIKNAALAGLKGLADGLVAAVRGAINRIIRFVNSVAGPLRGVLGKIGVDLPKLPELGADKAPPKGLPPGTRPTGPRDPPRGLPPGTRPNGPRDRGDTGRTLQVNLHLDGKQIARAVIPGIQRVANSTASSRRGRYGGATLGIG